MRLRPDRTPHDPSPPPAQRTSATGRLATVRKALLAAAVTTTLALTMSGLAARPAAAVPGIQDAQASSPNNTQPVKRVNVACPPGTVGVGVSGVQSGGNDVRVTELNVARSGIAVTAAVEQGAPARAWSLIVTVRCAPESSLPGLEYNVEGSGNPSSAPRHKAQARCSPGKRIIGMGGRVLTAEGSNAHRELVLTAVRASRGPQVVVGGSEDETGFSGTWRVAAIAVCVEPVGSQDIQTDATEADSTSPKGARASCPGTQIHSLGFDVSSARGQAHVTVGYLSTAPSQPQESAVIQASEDRTGYSGDWRVVVNGSCAN